MASWQALRPGFLDQMMPGMSGDALARTIRASEHLADIKLVIVLSGGRGAVEDGGDFGWRRSWKSRFATSNCSTRW